MRIHDEDARKPVSGAWLSGIPASSGVVSAPAFVATRTSDFRRIPEGAVLVTTMPRPELTPSLSQVAAIVAERGGTLSHAAIVARDVRVPCVVGAKGAMCG